ncbi:helix-turn-helix domain-containing protein [Amycolatopsis sp. NBC_01307]|uniref:AraC-like ligand-binding domain-containing protein n=1 Tax=Amycolatopsis sp. NBC_01307 TaxID=2903561 RepID=UPI002E126B79|nr:helix-turn-helix domain-containing protein [Amycolatopsis sp. NBC_01307]
MTFPVYHRGEAWRERLGGAFSELFPERLDSSEPAGDVVTTPLGEVHVYTVAGTPQIVRRSPGTIRQNPSDLLKVCVQVRGRATVVQGDREIVVEPGQLALYDTGRPYALRLEGEWISAVMAFPRDVLHLPTARAMEHAFPATNGPGAVFADFVSASVAQGSHLYAAAASRLGDAGLSLLAGTLTEHVSVDEIPDALRARVLDHVQRHLDDPRLSRATVAAAHGMSPRTLNRLFEDEPHTVTDHIRRLRLDAVRRDLRDPLLANRSVAAIASRWCFVDAAHFSRVFRAEFGESPSAFRLTSARPGPPRTAPPGPPPQTS